MYVYKNKLYTASYDNTIIRWDVVNKKPLIKIDISYGMKNLEGFPGIF